MCSLLGGLDDKESACNVGGLGSIPVLGRSPGGRHGNPLQHSYLAHPHGQRSLVGYSPWGHKESNMTATKHTAQCSLLLRSLRHSQVDRATTYMHVYVYTLIYIHTVLIYIYSYIYINIESHEFTSIFAVPTQCYKVYFVFSLFILITTIFESKTFYSHYPQSIHLCAHSPLYVANVLTLLGLYPHLSAWLILIISHLIGLNLWES